MKKVLVVEDDPNIVDLIEIHLNDLGCTITRAEDGMRGLAAAEGGGFDLIILDLMLPFIDGLEVCRRLRMQQVNTPILMLTAKSEEIDKVLGLETGADDYLTKPFSIRELIARVKAIFRRNSLLEAQQKQAPKNILDYGDLVIDLEKRKVSLNTKRVDLSPKEFELLALMAANPGKSYDRQQLLTLVWGYDFDGFEHTVNSHINRLRRKIEPQAEQPRYIMTTWGVGYRFNEEL